MEFAFQYQQRKGDWCKKEIEELHCVKLKNDGILSSFLENDYHYLSTTTILVFITYLR